MWFKKTGRQKVEDFLADHRLFPPKRSYGRWVIVGLVLVLVVILFVMIPLFCQGIKITRNVLASRQKVESLIDAASVGNWQRATEQIEGLRQEAGEANRSLRNLGPILVLPAVAQKANVAGQLIAAADKLLSAYQKLFVFLAEAGSQTEEAAVISLSDSVSRRSFLKSIQENQKVFAAIEQDINEAKADLALIDTSDLAGLLKEQLLLVDSFLEKATDNTGTALPIISHLPELLGYGQEKIYLFLFQNNMEIRPTGGFLGSYGILTVQDGEIKNIVTDDIYNLDKFSEGKLEIKAPEPMQKYNSQKYWYMRDANWSPDWPTSARQIAWFFDEETKNAGLAPKKIDGIIAITPDFISNLIGVVGPLVAENITFEPDNFAMALEQFVEFDYLKHGFSKNQRKAIIGDLTKSLFDKISQASPLDSLRLWLAFKKNIDEKHILVFLFNDRLQSYFAGKNWSGDVLETADDYLMVIDSNLAALKTDSVMEKSISYNLSLDGQGDLLATVAIDYSHRGDYIKDLITRYRDYVKVYAPKGSWFLSAKIKSDQGDEELGLGEDVNFSEELEKTSAATFFTVEPKKQKTLVFVYRLPERIKEQYKNGLYKIIVQKQSGTSGHNLKINLNFDKAISAYKSEIRPSNFGGTAISWETDLAKDREFVVKF